MLERVIYLLLYPFCFPGYGLPDKFDSLNLPLAKRFNLLNFPDE
jgi:hypothetical protein